MQLNDSFFDLPPNLRPDSSGVVVHMGSAKRVCSLVSDSARAPIVVHLRPIPQIYEFDHGIDEVRHRPDHEAWLTKNHLLFYRLRGRTPLALWSIWVRRGGHACAGLTQQEPLSCSPQAIPQIYEFVHGTPHRFCRDNVCGRVPVNAICRWHIDLLLQPDPTPVSAQLVMFTEAWTGQWQRIRSCAESREIQ